MHLNALVYLLSVYFRIEKHVTTLAVVNCRPSHENAILLKGMYFEEMSVLVIRLDNATVAVNNLMQISNGLHSLGIYLDYNCESSQQFIEICEGCFVTRFKWLILDKLASSESNQPLIRQLNSTNLFVDAEICYVNQRSSTSFAMYDIYNNGLIRGGKLNVTFDRFFVTRNESKHFFTESALRQRSKYGHRNRMTDVTLRIATVMPNHERFDNDDDLIQYLLTDNNTAVDTIPRYATNMGLLIKDVLLFNAIYIRFSKWAGNDTYGEGIEAIATDKVDFASTFYLLTMERTKHFSPITQITEFRSRFFFLTTIQNDLSGEYFRQPFVSTVWFCLVSLVILVSFALRLIDWSERRNDMGSLSVAFGMFCQQGADEEPRLLSGRCVFLLTLLISLTVYNYYTSVLVSTLVKSGSKNKINTITDLANSPLDVGFEDIAYMRSFLNTTQDPEFKYFIEKKMKVIDDKYFMENRHGFHLVERERFAFHCEANTAFPIIGPSFTQRAICDLNVMPFRRDKLQSFVIRKNSPYHDIFAVKFFWMRETGLISKHQRHWMAMKPPCLSNALFSSIDFASTIASVALLTVGYLLSLLVLILEMCVHAYNNKIKKVIVPTRFHVMKIKPCKTKKK